MISLGIDVGGTTVKTAALHDGSVLWTARSRRYHRPGHGELIEAIRETCARLNGPLQRVGLCVPGILDERRAQVTYSANVPGLTAVPLGRLIADAVAFHDSPFVTNDANATAFDIYSTRKISGRLLVLAIGSGVGASVLDQGKPLFVDGESPGHIGQIDVLLEDSPVIGPDGGRGGLEAYLGAPALRARYGSDPTSRIRPDDPAFRALVRAIRICHALFRPHHICLAGGTGIRLGHLLSVIAEAVNDQLTSVARRGWTLSVGDSDFHGACGAARISAAGAWPP